MGCSLHVGEASLYIHKELGHRALPVGETWAAWYCQYPWLACADKLCGYYLHMHIYTRDKALVVIIYTAHLAGLAVLLILTNEYCW